MLDPATIRVFLPGGLEAGEHEIDVTMYFRSPYMPTGDNHQYMPMNGCGTKVLTIKD